MKLSVIVFAAAFLCAAAVAEAQAQLRLQINNGRVTLHADNVPVRTILAEWARLGGAKIINGDRVAGQPLTLVLEDVPERQALDIVLRGVAGYMLAARDAGTAGASMYDRIMILPTSVAPRNPPPPAAPPVFQGRPAGIVRPILPQPARDDQEPGNDDNITPDNPGIVDGVPLGRPMPIPRPVNVPPIIGVNPVMPPIVTPDAEPAQPQLPAAGIVPTPANPFGLPAGSSTRPGVVTPVPQAPQGAVPRPAAQD